jgi:hypothetical protein
MPLIPLYYDTDTQTYKKLNNSGGYDTVDVGGSGGGGTVLQSPDTTLWLIGVNDSGALQTTQVASGTPGTLSLFSPDNTEWEVTVNNSGALTTAAI